MIIDDVVMVWREALWTRPGLPLDIETTYKDHAYRGGRQRGVEWGRV